MASVTAVGDATLEARVAAVTDASSLRHVAPHTALFP